MLLGRDTERAMIAQVLNRAHDGHGGALVLHGEAGIGKSALLDSVGEDARDVTVLRTAGIESESPLAFAALHRLLQPLMAGVASLPGPQAHALGQVLGLQAPKEAGTERFLVFLAVLTLISEAAEGRPVVCIIDDAHWLDEASAAALLFVARRIDVSAVGMLFAARDGGPRRFDWEDLPALSIQGLPEDAAGELLLHGTAGIEIAVGVRQELIRRTGRNPLALVELPGALSTEQLAGLEPLPSHLPLTDGLERVFLDRYRSVPASAQAFALVASVDDSGDSAIVRDAAQRLGAVDGEDDAVGAGLIVTTGTRVHVRHPLVRSAIYLAAPDEQRRRAHLALAEALELRGETDRATWHRASAQVSPDEPIAADLDAIARRFHQQGGHEAASAAWERAATLSEEGELAATRTAAAAMAAWLAGKPDRAKFLAQSARARSTDPATIAQSDRLRAFVEMNFGSPTLAHGILAHAATEAAASGHLSVAGELAMIATTLAAFGASSGATIAVGDLLAVSSPDDGAAGQSALLLSMDHYTHGRLEAAESELQRALRLRVGLTDPDLLANVGVATLLLGDDEQALRWHDIQLDQARLQSSPIRILHALTRRAIAQLSTAQWDELSAAADEVSQLAGITGQQNQRLLPSAQILVVGAYRGEDTFEPRAEQLQALLSTERAGVLDRMIADTFSWAQGIRRSAQDAVAAAHYFDRIVHPMLRRAAFYDILDVAIQVGDTKTATAITDDMARFAAATGHAWAAAAAGHGRALLAHSDADAESHFEEALAHHAGSSRPFNHARTRLAYGQQLRRARRRVDARGHLRVALAIFDGLDTGPWSGRAAEELRASGETARRRGADSAERVALTAQELQVARLVQQGLSNRDVAARLFISPRTVDFHLRNVFAKLGVSSRGALVGQNITQPT
ncbi:LuxR family transcriptional regulator [Cryobacterium sp. BB307]|uniref:AAA family ATPase n=1 Tax=Cryobacterium sp. BB307 TaxID=2716317 RepID=UPI0014478391